MPEFRNRPEQYPAIGALGKTLQKVDEFARKPFGYDNPPAAMISDFLDIPGVYKTAENINYGSPLTRGTGQARQMTDDTKAGLFGAMNLAPGVSALAKAMKGKPVGLTVRPINSQVIFDDGQKELNRLLRRHNGWEPRERLEILKKDIANKLERGEVTPGDSLMESAESFIKDLERRIAVNDWVKGPLAKYVKRDMGSPKDPVRELADQGIVHAEFGEEFAKPTTMLKNQRKKAGFPEEGEAKTPEGKRYEAMADVAAGPPERVGSPESEEIFFGNKNPPDWWNKLDEGTPVYTPAITNMGFNRIVDALDDLTKAGVIRPEQLSKVSVADAVKLTHGLDAKRFEENLVRMGKSFPVHKQYEDGFHWVDLKAKPAQHADDLTPNARKKYDEKIEKGVSDKQALDHANDYHVEELTEQALNREGSVMQNCIKEGGFCAPILEGNTKIYSLRDKSGKSHVSVEATRPTADDVYDSVRAEFERFNDRSPTGDELQQAIDDRINESPWEIRQIKGKQNDAPVADYQPYVADFVRSGSNKTWSPDISDIGNTDLVKVAGKWMRRSELEQLHPNFITPNDDTRTFRKATDHINDLFRNYQNIGDDNQRFIDTIRDFTPPEMKSGGSVNLRSHYLGTPMTQVGHRIGSRAIEAPVEGEDEMPEMPKNPTPEQNAEFTRSINEYFKKQADKKYWAQRGPNSADERETRFGELIQSDDPINIEVPPRFGVTSIPLAPEPEEIEEKKSNRFYADGGIVSLRAHYLGY